MCGILPRLSQSSEWWSRAIGVNARMEVFCRENNIGFIDGWDHFTSRKHMYARDGVHLSNSGVSVLAGMIDRESPCLMTFSVHRSERNGTPNTLIIN
ncbi:hypothetical protein SK128_008573 [Halocaridina rubra]|uniref:SGNH hydrolase-type esterase domain-containing protein n=1 Tax=Halocaridina rubra TaxID=373956 RepID=A0AAN8XWI3_HALRR